MSSTAQDKQDPSEPPAATAAAADRSAGRPSSAKRNLPTIVAVTVLSVLLISVSVVGGQAWFRYVEVRERDARDAAAGLHPEFVALSQGDRPTNAPAYRWADGKKERAVIPLTDAGRLLVEQGGKPGWATTQPAELRAQALAGASAVQGLNKARVSAGRAVFNRFGCGTCHTVDGAPGVGPSLLNSFGSTVELATGETVPFDADYMISSIRQPAAKVHKGYQPVMPDFGPQIKDSEIRALTEFLKSVSPEPASRKYTGPVAAPK